MMTFPDKWIETAAGRHCQVMNARFPTSLKRNVYHQCIVPILTYSVDSWRITKQPESKLVSAQRTMHGTENVKKGRTTAALVREQIRLTEEEKMALGRSCNPYTADHRLSVKNSIISAKKMGKQSKGRR